MFVNNIFNFVTDFLLRYLSQRLQVLLHKCHLDKSQSQNYLLLCKTKMIHRNNTPYEFFAIFLLIVLLIFKNVQKPIFLFLVSFFRKSEKIMHTKFSSVENLRVSMLSPPLF